MTMPVRELRTADADVEPLSHPGAEIWNRRVAEERNRTGAGYAVG